MKFNLKKIIPHFVAISTFLILSCIYFSPIFNDYILKQSDIQQYRGMEKEIVDYRLINEAEPLWTNSMFGGMPAYQISVKHPNNYISYVDQFLKLGLPKPIGLLFMAMLGFYIFALCLRINPWLGILGALAFGFSTINILYIGAGHITKVNSIAFIAPTLGGLILAFRGKWLVGSAVFSLFFALNLSANHLQMTYYLVLLLLVVSISETIRLIIEKQYTSLVKIIGCLAIAAILAPLPSIGNLLTTLEYSKFTTRGATDLTIKPKNSEKENVNQNGLEKSYILEYNYGSGELLSLIAPNAKGEKGEYIGNDDELMSKISSNYPQQISQQIAQMNRYWGGQRISGGAFYFGVIMVVFFLFGLVFIKDSLKWPFLVLSILALMLSMNNPGGINDFFINKIPLYNKFRDSKMILVLIQVMVPIVGVMFLDKLFKKEGLIGNKKTWLIGSGILTFIAIILYFAPSISGSFLSNDEIQQFSKAINSAKETEQIKFFNELKNTLIEVRIDIYKSDIGRAIFLIILGCSFILIAVYSKISTMLLTIIGIFIVTLDNMSIAKRYLNNENLDGKNVSWQDITKGSIPYLPETADNSILNAEKTAIVSFDSKVNQLATKMETAPNYAGMSNSIRQKMAEFGVLSLNSDYRVLSAANTFNETNTSYFHKSIGGYHGAKLKSYQEMIDFHIGNEIQSINEEINAAKNIKLRMYASQLNITQDQAQAVFDTIKVEELALTDKTPVLNMMNTKYILLNKSMDAIKNTNANGAAWFVNKIKKVKSSNDEMLAIYNLDSKNTALVNVSKFKKEANSIKENYDIDSSAAIVLTKYGTNVLNYTSTSKQELPAIFSEIYYPEGWNCYIDGKESPSFRANYILRGAIIPAGKHNIQWKFEPKTFILGGKVALFGSISLLLSSFLIFGLALSKSWKDKE